MMFCGAQMEKLSQPVELYFVEPKAAPKGLADTLARLREIEKTLHRIAAGPAINPKLTQSVNDIAGQLDRVYKARSRLAVGDIGKALGLDAPQVEQLKRRLGSLRGEIEGISKRGLYFNNVRDAASGVRKAFDAEIKQAQKNYDRVLGTAGAGLGAKAGKATATVAGVVPVLIPATQVQASVVGPIAVTIPGAQIQAVAAAVPAAGGRDPKTGKFLPAPAGAAGESPASGGGKRGQKKSLQPPPQGAPKQFPEEVSRTVTQTQRGARVAVETMLDGGKSLTRTFDDVGDEIKRVTKDPALRNIGKKLSTDLANFKRQAQADVLNTRTGDKVKDLQTMARVKDDLAKNIRQSFAGVEKSLPAPARESLKRVYQSQAEVVEAQAKEARRLAGVETQAQAQAAAEQQQERDSRARRLRAQRRNARQSQMEKERTDQIASAGPLADAGVQAAKREILGLEKYQAAQRLASAHEERAKIYQELARRTEFSFSKRAGYARQAESSLTTAAKMRAVPPPAPAPPPPTFWQRMLGGESQRGLVARGLSSFQPANMAKNILTVGAWGAAVTAAFAPVQLAMHSLTRLTEIGLQTARLEQVFRGVGGSAQQLTDDVLRLAAANGRSTDEAMEAAVAWSRLGLTRTQVNEAVRVSLMAANVAEMSAADATGHLSAITQTYGLRVSELEGVLGMLNETSNTARVTNADLLTGLSNVAALAKQAGFSLAELQGLLGAGVELTGQTGSRMSNALKTVIGRMSRDDVQMYLRDRVGVEAQTESGESKSRRDVLRETFIAYKRLTEAERVNLASKVAGAHQASRFTAVMDSYLRGQELAITAQENLSSAQEENAKILTTLKAQVAGLGSEWDRLVVKMGNASSVFGGPSFNETMTSTARALKNVMRLYNELPTVSAKPERERRGPLGNYVRSLGLMATSPTESLKEQLAMWDKLLMTKQDRGELRFGNRIQQLQLQGGAQASQAMLFDTLASALGTARPENRAGLAKFAAKFMADRNLGGGDLEGLVARGDVGGAQNQLQAAGVAARQRAAELQQQMVTSIGELRAGYQAELEKLESGNAAKERRLELQQKILDLDIKSGEVGARYADLMNEGNEAVEQRLQSVLDLKAASETMVQLFQRLADLGAGDSEMARGESRAQALQAELDLLERTKQVLYDIDKSGNNIQPVLERIKDVRAALAAERDPGVLALRETLDRQTFVTRRAQEDADNMGVGTSQAERLLNREKQLQEELTRLKQRRADWSLTEANREADNARALVLQNQLLVTQEQIQKRIRDLVVEEQQARLEAQREFDRSLIGSGPGELLQKFAAFQLNQRGPMGAGQFFSLAPGLRTDVDLLNGGDAVRRLRDERNRLRNVPTLTPEEEAARRAAGFGPDGFRPTLPTLPPVPPPVAPGLETAKVNAELNAVATAATGTALALTNATAQIQGQVNKFVLDLGMLLEGRGTGPGGISTGWSAGERF
jgi:TP901 family phage tail tape measure protein